MDTNFENLIQFDRKLSQGQRVEVRWTSAGCNYRGFGAVVKLNAKSARVALEEPVGNYPAGFEVIAPRFLSAKRTPLNGIFPTEAPVQAQPIKRGYIEEIRANGEQRVVTDTGETHFLTPGYNAAKGGRVHDRVELEYRATATLGLWYGRVIPRSPLSRRCQCGAEYVPKTIADGYCPSCMEAQRKADESVNR